MTETRHAANGQDTAAPEHLGAWVRAGLVTDEQAKRITEYEAAAVPTVPGPRAVQAAEPAGRQPIRGGRNQLAVEALAYLGGALTLAATLLIVDLVWGDLSTVTRLAIPLTTTMLALAAGLLVSRDHRAAGSLLRLRSAFWLVGLGTWAAFLGVLGDEALDLAPQRTWLLVGAGGVMVAAPLYQVCTAAPQQLGLLGTCLTVAGATGAQPDWNEPTLIGFGIWLVAVAWFGLGLRTRIPPPLVAQYAGAAALVIGAILMSEALAGQLLALATLIALYLVGVRLNSLGILGVAAFGTLLIVPRSMSFFFPHHERVVAPLGLLLMGVVLVGSAVVVTRRRAVVHVDPREQRGAGERDRGR
jgi:Predicted membrane protein (DUF2157)